MKSWRSTNTTLADGWRGLQWCWIVSPCADGPGGIKDGETVNLPQSPCQKPDAFGLQRVTRWGDNNSNHLCERSLAFIFRASERSEMIPFTCDTSCVITSLIISIIPIWTNIMKRPTEDRDLKVQTVTNHLATPQHTLATPWQPQSNILASSWRVLHKTPSDNVKSG